MFSKHSNLDNFCWIELAGFLPDSKMFRNQFVRIDDIEAIHRWRNKFNNIDVFTSICRYEKPDWQSDFIAPLFFDIDSPDDLTAARESALILCELIMTRLKIDSDQIQICFSSCKGFHVTVPCEVFNPSPSELTLELYKKMATNAKQQGVIFVDMSVYTNRRLWRLTNSVNSKSRLFKIPLTYEELRDNSIEGLLKLAETARPEDSFVIPGVCDKAAEWYCQAIECFKKNKQHISTGKLNTKFKGGWRMPPCIKAIQIAVIPDGIRHETYLSFARYCGYLNMHPDEINERIDAIDMRNPIRDPDSIERIVDFGFLHPGFPGCDNSVLMRYCRKNRCFYERLKTK